MATPAADSASAITVQELPRLHGLTKAVASFCREQLAGHLETLAPLFRPRRVLGDYIEGSSRENVVRADHHFARLQEAYRKVAQRPFGLRGELRAPLESVASDVRLYEREYAWTVESGAERPRIVIRSPLTWALTYPSTYSPAMLRGALAQGEKVDSEAVRSFVLRALLMDLLFEAQPGLRRLLEALRFEVSVEKLDETGDLPLVMISAPFPTVRPGDETLLAAIGISGRPACDEVLDLQALREISDPLRDQIRDLLRQHGEEI